MIGEICTFPGNLRFFANLAWAWSVRGSRRCVRFIHMARSMFSECKVIGYLQIRDVRWEESNLVSRTKVHFILQKGWLQQGAARAALNIPDGEIRDQWCIPVLKFKNCAPAARAKRAPGVHTLGSWPPSRFAILESNYEFPSFSDRAWSN